MRKFHPTAVSRMAKLAAFGNGLKGRRALQACGAEAGAAHSELAARIGKAEGRASGGSHEKPGGRCLQAAGQSQDQTVLEP